MHLTHRNFKLLLAAVGLVTVWCVQEAAEAKGARWSLHGGGSLARPAVRAQAFDSTLVYSRSRTRSLLSPGLEAGGSSTANALLKQPLPGQPLREAPGSALRARDGQRPAAVAGSRPGPKLSRQTWRGFSPPVRDVLSYLKRTGKTGPATFDGDGTLWAGDVGLGFFEWMLRERHYPQGRLGMLESAYHRYRKGQYDGEKFYELMVTAMAGMRETRVARLADQYFRTEHRSRIYRPMVNMIGALQGMGIEPWVVSGSPYWVVAAGARQLGIPTSRVIGLSVQVDKHGLLTNRIVRPVPWKAGKAKRIMMELGQVPVFAAGNSYGDIQMLRIASEPPLVINPCPTTLRLAETNGWTIHRYTQADEITLPGGGPRLRIPRPDSAAPALRAYQP